MFKVRHKLLPEIISDIFMERTGNQYNLRNRPDFITPHVQSVFHETESISYLGLKIWNIVPEEFMDKKSHKKFSNILPFYISVFC